MENLCPNTYMHSPPANEITMNTAECQIRISVAMYHTPAILRVLDMISFETE